MKRSVREQPIRIEVVGFGCVETTERALADRWGWSIAHVRAFLREREARGQIRVQSPEVSS